MSLYSGRNNMQDQYDYEYGGGKDNDEYEGYGNGYENEGIENDDDEQADEKGFEKRIQGEDDIFMFKKIELPGIPRN